MRAPPTSRANVRSRRASFGMPLALAFLFGLQAVFYTIDGWDGIIYFEKKSAIRDATFRARFSVALPLSWEFILLITPLCCMCFPCRKSQAILSCSHGCRTVFGHYGDTIMSQHHDHFAVECLNANQLFCSRTLYAMSCDRLFFRSFTRSTQEALPLFHCC